jgi:hypothetical protein
MTTRPELRNLIAESNRRCFSVFVNPLSDGWATDVFATQPSLEERITPRMDGNKP